MIEGAIFKAIKADNGAGGVATLLATYKSEIACFSGEFPDDAPFPCIMLASKGGSIWGTRGKKGAVVNVDVQVFNNKKRSSKDFRELVTKVYKLLDRHALPNLSDAGYHCVGCQASPPSNTNDGLGFDGYTISLAVRILEN